MPFILRIKFEYFKLLEELDKLKNIFHKINIIEKYSLEEFNINNSFFKIYYYGSPKRLKIRIIRIWLSFKK